MTKRELIDAIMARNASAHPEFLAKFGDGDLRDYLDQLERIRQPRLTGNAARFEKYFGRHTPSWAEQHGVVRVAAKKAAQQAA